MKTKEQLLEDAKTRLDELAESLPTHDAPAQRAALNEEADNILRDVIGEALLRDWITEDERDELDDEISDYAGSLHEVTRGSYQGVLSQRQRDWNERQRAMGQDDTYEERPDDVFGTLGRIFGSK